MNRPKKIAFVGNTSWSIFNFRLGVIRRFKELGYEVLIIAPKDHYTAKLLAEGFDYVNVQISNYGTNPLNDYRTFRQFIRIYRAHRPDFIFHYTIKPNIYGSSAAALCRIPSIAITTGLGHLFSYKNPVVKYMSFYLYRLAASLSKEVWFLNKDDLNIFVQKKLIKAKKAVLLHSEGINIQYFKPPPHHEQWQASDKQGIRFLLAGRIIWDKGIHEYVQAARAIKATHPNAQFQLLGFIDPSNPNYVSYEQIQEWQKEGIIEYLGETADVRPFLGEADCLVFPSFYREGISRILLEAASMAKPIITSDHVGCREVVEHQLNGFLCQPQNVKDLIKKIRMFIDIPARQRSLMGLNGRKKVLKEFDEEMVIEKYLQVLQKYQIIESKTKLNKPFFVSKK